MARILELEDDIQTISEKVLTKEVELDRLGDVSAPFYALYFLGPPLRITGRQISVSPYFSVSSQLHSEYPNYERCSYLALFHLSKCYSVFIIFRNNYNYHLSCSKS